MSLLCGIETIDQVKILLCNILIELPTVLCNLISDYINEYQTLDGTNRDKLIQFWKKYHEYGEFSGIDYDNAIIVYCDQINLHNVEINFNYNDQFYFIVSTHKGFTKYRASTDDDGDNPK